jgi:hypothetical protein
VPLSLSEISIQELALTMKENYEHYSPFQIIVPVFNLAHQRDKVYELDMASTLG